MALRHVDTLLEVQQVDIVIGLKVSDIAGKAAFVFRGDFLTGHQHDPASIGAQ